MCAFATLPILIAAALAALTTSAVASDRPNPALTPGSLATTNAAVVCRRGYSDAVRPTQAAWRSIKEAVYQRYGLMRGHRSEIDARGRRHPAYTIDHLVPLELGGSPSDVRNLWPQPRLAARRKDEVENRLHDLVCARAVPLTQAQRAIAHDWRTALANVLHAPHTPPHNTDMQP